MKPQPFARHFPVTFSHFDSFRRGMPHEKFAEKGSKRGKRACRVLVMQKTASCPFSTPFLTTYSFFLASLKLIEVSGRIFTLLNPTKNHIRHFILASKQATDYLLLTFIMPVRIVAEIVKLAVAMFFGSHLYFSPPDSYPLPIQLNYYQKNADKLFYHFRFARNVTLQIKAEAREIEHVHEKIVAELIGQEEKIKFLKDFIKLLKKINLKQIESKDLNALRAFCKKSAQENDIKIAFKTPQKKEFTYSSCSSTAEESSSSSSETEESSSEMTSSSTSVSTDFYSFNSDKS